MKNKMSEKIDIVINFLKNHWWILSFIAYFVWISIQVFFLIKDFWFVWLSYISIPFSLVISLIIIFLFILAIPIFLTLILYFFVVLNVKWIIISLVIWSLLWVLFAYLTKNDKEWQRDFEEKMNKAINLFYRYSWIIFTTIIIALISIAFSFKVAKISYWDKEVYWKYLFYNQDYYFMDICWEKLIISSNQVNDIKVQTESYKLISMTNKEKEKINAEYNAFCNQYINKNSK
jgi:hypothetical protein